MRNERTSTALGRLMHRVAVVGAAGFLTGLCLLVLPLIQAIGQKENDLVMVREVDTGELPPPDEIDEPEEEPEPEPEPEPPKLENLPNLDFSQLELALSPSMGSGFMSGSLELELPSLMNQSDDAEEVFDFGDLDQKPRPIDRVWPELPPGRRPAGGRVVLLFLVDEKGRVQSPKVKSTTHEFLSRPSLVAIKRWRFEPGRRQGKPVRFATKTTFRF